MYTMHIFGIVFLGHPVHSCSVAILEYEMAASTIMKNKILLNNLRYFTVKPVHKTTCIESPIFVKGPHIPVKIRHL